MGAPLSDYGGATVGLWGRHCRTMGAPLLACGGATMHGGNLWGRHHAWRQPVGTPPCMAATCGDATMHGRKLWGRPMRAPPCMVTTCGGATMHEGDLLRCHRKPVRAPPQQRHRAWPRPVGGATVPGDNGGQ